MADRGGVKRKCRPRYDPKLAESVAKRRVEHDKVKMNFESKIREVCELAPQMLLQTEWHCLGNDKNSHALEIALVSALGLKNVILIEKAINLIPSNTPDRYGVALDSVQAQLSSSCMSRSHYLRYIQLISEVLDLTVQDTSSDDCHTGSPIQERYLCPPVDRCVHDGGALVPNHSSTIVTVFTLTGPEVAKKYTLRCVACQCIYSYSMFGNKFKDGQVYYEKTRKLIEISDTVYCERSLYEMFCSLR